MSVLLTSEVRIQLIKAAIEVIGLLPECRYKPYSYEESKKEEDVKSNERLANPGGKTNHLYLAACEFLAQNFRDYTMQKVTVIPLGKEEERKFAEAIQRWEEQNVAIDLSATPKVDKAS